MYKALIIGCGKIAGLYDDLNNSYIYSHANSYNLNPKIDNIYFCDNDILKAEKLANKFSSRQYSNNYLNAIKEFEPHVISICTPNNTHYEITKEILETFESNNLQVIFLEKPACENIEELERLISLSNKKNVKIMINHTRRFDSIHQILSNKIINKVFGKILKIDAIYYGGWNHNGVHIVDTLIFLFNDLLIIEDKLAFNEIDKENDFDLDLKCRLLKNDVLVYLTTMDENAYQLFEIDLKFEKARIRLEDFGQRIVYEEKVINTMKENVLIKKDLGLENHCDYSPMQNAINKITSFLDGENSILDGYLIEDISRTMKTIWKGNKWAK